MEYDYDSVGLSSLNETLKERAENGWELVSVTEDDHAYYTLFWKRAK